MTRTISKSVNESYAFKSMDARLTVLRNLVSTMAKPSYWPRNKVQLAAWNNPSLGISRISRPTMYGSECAIQLQECMKLIADLTIRWDNKPKSKSSTKLSHIVAMQKRDCAQLASQYQQERHVRLDLEKQLAAEKNTNNHLKQEIKRLRLRLDRRDSA